MRTPCSYKAASIAAGLIYFTSSPASAFYLPGVTPTSYRSGDTVPLHVNSLTPADEYDHKVRSVFAFDYYAPMFHYCQPAGGPQHVSESLGSILFGDRIQTSPFKLYMNQNQTCKAVCAAQTFQPHDATFVNSKIWQGYNLNWLVDGLPAAQPLKDPETGNEFYSPGFALGYVVRTDAEDGEEPEEEYPIFNNHFSLLIDYHKAGPDTFRIVGVIVEPNSFAGNQYIDEDKGSCGDEANREYLRLKEDEGATTDVVFTYSVYWRESETPFATRWDKYLHVYDPRIQWLSLANSAVIVTVLIAAISAILLRTLRQDIARYNRLEQFALDDLSGTSAVEEGVQEDSGWKLVHGDVFRPPKNPLVLSVLIGNGAQLFMMAGFTIAFATLGFLSPSNRGALGTIMILLYTFFGFIGGYVSSRVYKFFGGEAWKQNFAYTPTVLPVFVFFVFFLLNLFVWARQASGAVPFGTMIVIVGLWFIISVPLSMVGSWLGFRSESVKPPVRTNQIPRQIPPAQGYLRPIPSMLLAGFLPFCAIYFEFYFIMQSLWFNKVYYMFGFLFLCFGLMVMTSACVTVLLVYFLLCSENYHWQWRAFLAAGTSALYIFLSAILYWVRDLSFSSWTSGVLYLGYCSLIGVLFFILTGTIGFIASWLFCLKIYGSIKVD